MCNLDLMCKIDFMGKNDYLCKACRPGFAPKIRGLSSFRCTFYILDASCILGAELIISIKPNCTDPNLLPERCIVLEVDWPRM